MDDWTDEQRSGAHSGQVTQLRMAWPDRDSAGIWLAEDVGHGLDRHIVSAFLRVPAKGKARACLELAEKGGPANAIGFHAPATRIATGQRSTGRLQDQAGLNRTWP